MSTDVHGSPLPYSVPQIEGATSLAASHDLFIVPRSTALNQCAAVEENRRRFYYYRHHADRLMNQAQVLYEESEDVMEPTDRTVAVDEMV